MIAATRANIGGVTERSDVRRQAFAAAEAAASKKGDDVAVLDVGEIIAITDYFVVVSAANERQVRTVVEEVEEQVFLGEDLEPLRVEGKNERRWVLLDYGDFWVHVFHRDTRDFYDIERLWADAERVPFSGADVATG